MSICSTHAVKPWQTTRLHGTRPEPEPEPEPEPQINPPHQRRDMKKRDDAMRFSAEITRARRAGVAGYRAKRRLVADDPQPFTGAAAQ